MDDFHNSYTSGSYTNQHVKNGIRQYVNLRNASLGSQLNPLNAPPVVYAMDHSPRYPLAEDSVHLNASCFGSAGIQQVKVLYFIGNSSDIQEVEMVFRPDTLQPQVRKHDRWTATLPPAGAGVRIWYRIEVTDSLLQKKQYPRNGWMPIQSVVNATGDLHINELMASNSVTIADPSGEYDDWVELYNPSSDPVLLTGCYLSDKADNPLKWRIEKETIIAPGGYLLIWCDEDALQPGLHASFKLSAAGESVLLTAADGLTLIDSVHFGSQATDVSFGRYPDATGPWQKMPPTPDASNRALSVPESPDAISGLYIFPNPADDRSSLVFPGSLSQSAILSVLNLSGRPVMPDTEIPAGCDRYTLSCSGLNPGLYFLRIQTNDQTRVLKLIKR